MTGGSQQQGWAHSARLCAAVGAEIDQLAAATPRDIRAGYRKRRQEVDEIEAHVATSKISAGQAAVVTAALQQAGSWGAAYSTPWTTTS